MMKKLVLIVILIMSISLVAPLLTSCATTPTVTSTQAAPTVTVTVTATPSSISSPAATTPIPVTVTVTPTSSTVTPKETVNPVAAQIESFNNTNFFISRAISGYNETVKIDGSTTKTPIYTDNYMDLDLGGFLTVKDATLIPKVSGITDHDDWIAIFTLPVYKSPWILNWGYVPQSDSPEAKLSLSIMWKSTFIDYYNESPALLNTKTEGEDRGTSDTGIHGRALSSPGTYVVLLRTANAEDIAGWWVKYGGQKYGSQ